MFGSMKSKSAIGVIAILLLTTLTPSAVAGKPGTTPTLNGSLCKSFAGVWVAKVRNCYITTNLGSSVGFIIDSKSQLIIENNGEFTNYSDITVNGSIVNYGTFNTSSNVYNYGTLVNFGNINSSNYIYNYSYIQQNGNWNGCVYNSNVIDGSYSNC